jgi:hypothetical protein
MSTIARWGAQQRLQQLEQEMRSLVIQYQALQARNGRRVSYERAEFELTTPNRQPAPIGPSPIDKEDLAAILAVARRNNKPFAEVLSAYRGERPFRYFQQLEKRPVSSNAPPDYHGKNPDPAARSAQEVHDAIANPGPLKTLRGKNCFVGGKLTKEGLELIEEWIKEQRRQGNSVSFADGWEALRKATGEV